MENMQSFLEKIRETIKLLKSVYGKFFGNSKLIWFMCFCEFRLKFHCDCQAYVIIKGTLLTQENIVGSWVWSIHCFYIV